jgi:two-component system nitrate/nitrite response regulator NarL
MGSVTISIVDDHPLFRAGVARSLAEAGGFKIVAEGSSHADALAIVDQHHPDLLLLDISIPGGGLAALQAILDRHRHQKIVMLTVSEAGGDVARAMTSGARGYILKGIEAETLAEILVKVAAGEGYVSPALSARLLSGKERRDGAMPSALDERQLHILQRVALGWSNKQIALELALQEKTVKHQLTRIFTILGVTNRTEAAMAYRDARDHESGRESLRNRA